MNPGPTDARGGYNPQLATMSYSEALRKGWIRRPEKCPPFWRDALRKVIDDRHQLVEAAARAERLGITDQRSAAIAEARIQRNEELLKARFPGWC